MRYLTTTDPSGAFVTEVAVSPVEADPNAEPNEAVGHVVGYGNDGDYGLSLVLVEEDLVITEVGPPRSAPPRTAAEPNTPESDAGRVTGGISNAHPDLTFGEAQPHDAEPEPESSLPPADPSAEEQAAVETPPGPADIPPPPEVPAAEAPAEAPAE